MRILHVISSADPKGGGPIEGVTQRGLRLHEMGHRVEVASLDDPSAAFVGSFPLKLHALGPGSLGTFRYSRRLLPWLVAHISDYDAIVVNGLWQYHGVAVWRAARRAGARYFVFPHGMLDPWFKRTYPLKHLKKWLVWPLADYRLLRDAQAVLFTSEEEKLQARRSFWLYQARECVVAYGTRSAPPEREVFRDEFLHRHPELRGHRLLLFLSRIHEKKGCDLLLRAFAAECADEPDLRLVMAGPDQAGWGETLKHLATTLGIADRVIWTGMLRDRLKWGAFYAAEAFVLPSHQENFGIAVAEALACSVAVLISDKVNIWREIEQAGAGLVFPDTLEGTRRLLSGWNHLTPAERAVMRARAAALFAARYTVEAMAQSLLDVITEPTHGTAAP